VTDRAIYNFKGKSITHTNIIYHLEVRRRIAMEKLAGITISKHQNS
jgi:hypothetical protein